MRRFRIISLIALALVGACSSNEETNAAASGGAGGGAATGGAGGTPGGDAATGGVYACPPATVAAGGQPAARDAAAVAQDARGIGLCPTADLETDPANCGICGNTCLMQLFWGGRAQVMAVDGNGVYLGLAGGIVKVPLDGGAPVTLVSGSSTWDLAVDATNLYWSEPLTDGIAIMKAPLAGGTPTVLATKAGDVTSIAVDATSVYWTAYGNGTNSGSVMKVPIDGGPSTTVAAAQNGPSSIALDGSSIYWWVNTGGYGPSDGSVMKASLAGGSPVTLAANARAARIVVDGRSVYWTDPLDGAVMKVPRDGGTPTAIASNQNNPTSIAVDATGVYWTDRGQLTFPYNGSVMKLPHGATTPTVLASEQNLPFDIAVNAGHVYWRIVEYNFVNNLVVRLEDCRGGVCQFQCPSTLLLCANRCVDTQVDPTACGECGNRCRGTCTNGKCDPVGPRLEGCFYPGSFPTCDAYCASVGLHCSTGCGTSAWVVTPAVLGLVSSCGGVAPDPPGDCTSALPASPPPPFLCGSEFSCCCSD